MQVRGQANYVSQMASDPRMSSRNACHRHGGLQGGQTTTCNAEQPGASKVRQSPGRTEVASPESKSGGKLVPTRASLRSMEAVWSAATPFHGKKIGGN